jgi:hypothetical protein
MDSELRRVLEAAYPGAKARYFSPMSIGSTPEHADEGVTLILNTPMAKSPSSERSACCWTERVDLVASSRRHGWRLCLSRRTLRFEESYGNGCGTQSGIDAAEPSCSASAI